MNDKNIEEISEYLNKVNHPFKDRCCICTQSHTQIKKSVIDCGSLVTDGTDYMTYKLSKPICVFCFINIKHNKKLILEVMTSRSKQLWKSWDIKGSSF